MKDYKPQNTIITFLSGIYFKIKLLPASLFRWLMRLIILLGFSPVGWRKIGPYQIGLDAREKFQRFMLLDQYEQSINSIVSRILQPGDTYVDIGTQLGYTAAIAANSIGKNGRMVLFEPDPRAITRLKVHLSTSEADQGPEVDLIEAACSSKSGTLNFEISDILGHSRIINSTGSNEENIIQVPIVVADDALENLGIEIIHFLKIDAEGHELNVLRGLQKYLSSQKIKVLMVEKNIHSVCNFGVDSEFIHSLIARHGYLGIHEVSGMQVTRDSLRANDVDIENLFYSYDADLLSNITDRKLNENASGYTKEEIEEFHEIAINPEHPIYHSQEIVALAETGNSDEAIEQAEKFLSENPDQVWLRGHLAHWLLSAGEKKRSTEHYQILASQHPENPVYTDILNRL